MVALIGSIAADKPVMHFASETPQPVLLEPGGKNALITLACGDRQACCVAEVNVALEALKAAWAGNYDRGRSFQSRR
jgi:hypothetical protein